MGRLSAVCPSRRGFAYARPERTHAVVEPQAVAADARREFVVDVVGFDAHGLRGVALQVPRLRAVHLRDAGVAAQHVSRTDDLDM